MNDTPSPDASGSNKWRRLFGLGFLLWLLLTALTFRFVSRYMINVAALYDYDIENVAVQFGIYFALFAGFGAVAAAIIGILPTRLSSENQLRLVFAVGVTLSLIVAIYQSRFGTDKLVNYFTVGTLGTFAAALAVTHRRFRLVEVIAQPSDAVLAEVLEAHRAVHLAANAWDHAKRLIEIAASLIIVLISLPIFVPLAVVVWLQDPGPLLVAKVAVKRAGASFRQLKLRTMLKDAELATGPVPAAPDDSRVTWLGGVLRRTHIDELPQMINILWGDMSLVGPRPERTVFVRRHLLAIDGYAGRHAVRPGLAGMAQVYGDYYSTPSQKLRYDLLYIRRRGPGLDLRLFGAAVLIALFGVRLGRPRDERYDDHKRREQERFGRAYEALRGESAPDTDGESAPDADGQPAPDAGGEPGGRADARGDDHSDDSREEPRDG